MSAVKTGHRVSYNIKSVRCPAVIRWIHRIDCRPLNLVSIESEPSDQALIAGRSLAINIHDRPVNRLRVVTLRFDH
jgi:hypothetical protein